MSMGDKRWSVGKNDIDRDNKMLSRDPNLSAYVPSDDSITSNYSKKNVRRRIIALVFAIATFAAFYFGGKILPLELYDTIWFLLISLMASFAVYRFSVRKRKMI
ncbi:hypothetical protein [Enterococcus sp. BWR-S5]|uniref:hypothetical protein n=1 Tax=Enterococcus sp. BWR-S5 TaxID=2787714 RepID=UPI0019207BA0|nr:hypothetical protein [Enterococcus sp. BWR-S5]MBL1224542.1 hypothetical protein [Enterococcus sp. BWR-S5]